MAKTLQFRRGTTSELSTETGAVGELFVDTTKDTVVVMDGSTAGGFSLATEQYVDTSISDLFNSESTALNGPVSIYWSSQFNQVRFNTTDSSWKADAEAAASTATKFVITTDSATYEYDNVNYPVNSTIDGPFSGPFFGYIWNGWNASGWIGSAPPDTSVITITGFSAVVSSQIDGLLSTKQNTLVSGTNIKTINGQTILGGGNIDVASSNLSQVDQNILPLFSEIYDIGSTDKRWYDGYFSNNIDINGSQLTGAEGTLSTNSDFVVGSLLADQILISDNMITPDDSSARQYFGDKGVVIINGNLTVDGDWLSTPVVKTLPSKTIPELGSDGMIRFNADENQYQAFKDSQWNAMPLGTSTIIDGSKRWTYDIYESQPGLAVARLYPSDLGNIVDFTTQLPDDNFDIFSDGIIYLPEATGSGKCWYFTFGGIFGKYKSSGMVSEWPNGQSALEAINNFYAPIGTELMFHANFKQLQGTSTLTMSRTVVATKIPENSIMYENPGSSKIPALQRQFGNTVNYKSTWDFLSLNGSGGYDQEVIFPAQGIRIPPGETIYKILDYAPGKLFIRIDNINASFDAITLPI